MFCGNCGEKLDDGTKFCGKCGSKVAENTADTPVAVGTEQRGSQTIPQTEQENVVLTSSAEKDDEIDLRTFMPKTSEDFVKRGIAQIDSNLAIADYTEAIRLDPNNADAYQERGLEYLDNGQNDLVIADFTMAIHFHPTSNSYYFRGLAYSNNGLYDLAIADLTEAIRLDPIPVCVNHYHRGNAYYRKGQYDLAIEDFTVAIRCLSDPNDYSQVSLLQIDTVYGLRGIAYFKNGQYDLAFADFNQVIRLDPNDSGAYMMRGNVYFVKGQFDLAIADCNQAIRLDPNNSVVYTIRGNAYFQKKQYDLAIADFTEVLRTDPNDSEARYNLELAKKAKGGCFITTAVCGSFSKPDDCYELTQFRNFRDNWLLAQPDGKQIVDRYYQIAPGIVAAIDKTSESKAIYTGIWNNYLAECLRLIETGKLEDCKTKYTDMVETLEHRYLV